MRRFLNIVGGCLIFSVFGFMVLGLHGCGYTTRSSLISTKYLTIFITPFINKIDITLETDTGSKYKV
ncbi:MAG: hypothetical protein WC335_06225, partial [Candidatus Omnitrophota bacterium]